MVHTKVEAKQAEAAVSQHSLASLEAPFIGKTPRQKGLFLTSSTLPSPSSPSTMPQGQDPSWASLQALCVVPKGPDAVTKGPGISTMDLAGSLPPRPTWPR